MRKTKFANEEYYHVYNRGVDKREIFIDDRDYVRFVKSMRRFNNSISCKEKDYYIRKLGEQELSSRYRELSSETFKLVDLVCYCLNFNHYHFLLKQNVDNGISLFMHKISTSHTNHFNIKYQRSGSLFQGRFKAVHINTNEYIIWLSAYINTNPKIHGIVTNLKSYPWSSYLDYVGLRKGTLCNKGIILNQFDNKNYRYEDFVKDSVWEMKKRKSLQKYFIEEN